MLKLTAVRPGVDPISFLLFAPSGRDDRKLKKVKLRNANNHCWATLSRVLVLALGLTHTIPPCEAVCIIVPILQKGKLKG